jgi:hypothetical protein
MHVLILKAKLPARSPPAHTPRLQTAPDPRIPNEKLMRRTAAKSLNSFPRTVRQTYWKQRGAENCYFSTLSAGPVLAEWITLMKPVANPAIRSIAPKIRTTSLRFFFVSAICKEYSRVNFARGDCSFYLALLQTPSLVRPTPILSARSPSSTNTGRNPPFLDNVTGRTGG